ncbi:hypothetical protein GCM10029964_007320 [Kibdelosporangium lantanae]
MRFSTELAEIVNGMSSLGAGLTTTGGGGATGVLLFWGCRGLGTPVGFAGGSTTGVDVSDVAATADSDGAATTESVVGAGAALLTGGRSVVNGVVLTKATVRQAAAPTPPR